MLCKSFRSRNFSQYRLSINMGDRLCGNCMVVFELLEAEV